ncbi:MAG: flippase-like domain-containing protein [Lachnospiraceae bacterium]|nr:flippase-like domain-containing protein [Lachnospiraceae bacterium]
MKKRALWTIAAIIIAALSIWAVFANAHSLTFAEIADAIRHGHTVFLCAAVLCMLGFIVFEALSLLWILRYAGYPRSLAQGIVYSAGDVYFSAITPSASGGQPASMFFMRENGIPGAVITVTLILNLVMYTLAILVIGVLCLIFKADVFFHFNAVSKTLIVIGFAALTGLACIFYGLLRRGGVLRAIGNRLITLLATIRLMRHPDKWREKLDRLVEEYRMCAATVSGKKRVLSVVFLFDFLQRAAQISVTLMMYYALGGEAGGHGADLFAIQTFSQIGSNCVPVPGGMGVADYLMLDGFSSIFAGDYAFQLELLSRGLSFYICTLLSGLIVVLGYVGSKRKHV